MKPVRNFLAILSLGIILAGFWSCQKDESLTSNDALASGENELLTTTLASDPDASQNPCYKIVFPVQVKLLDGTIVSVENQEELDKILRKASTNPRAGRAHIVFPYDVILKNGTQVTVHNQGEIERILKGCRTRVNPDPGAQLCYTLSYPLTYLLKDGSTITIQNKEEHEAFLKRWAASNRERPQLTYPYNVTLRNGDVLTIANDEDFRKLQELCKRHRNPVDPKPTPCFELQFPLSVKLQNGDIIIVNSPEELNRLMQNRPTAANRNSIQFPYDVKLVKTGEIITIENEEDLKTLLENCKMR
ncbi:MAG: hypothetical protein IPM48_01035 [Saprospiraceae bacterium]|nr:hypothetical protein [Saprospiraceae bacterium]